MHKRKPRCRNAGSVDCIDAASFQNPEGKDVVYAVDLVAFVNSLMFNCTLASMP